MFWGYSSSGGKGGGLRALRTVIAKSTESKQRNVRTKCADLQELQVRFIIPDESALIAGKLTRCIYICGNDG